jgi:hypothetical protein
MAYFLTSEALSDYTVLVRLSSWYLTRNEYYSFHKISKKVAAEGLQGNFDIKYVAKMVRYCNNDINDDRKRQNFVRVLRGFTVEVGIHSNVQPPIKDTAVNSASKRRELLQKLESVLKELNEKGNAALQNPTCQKILKLKSTKIVTLVRHKVEIENREFIKQQHNERDAQLTTSHAGGGDGGGDGGGFDFEDVPSSSDEEGNKNNGGHQGNRGANGREHFYHDRLNKEAEQAAAGKNGTYVSPFAPTEPRPEDHRPSDRPYGWVAQNAKGRSRRGKGTGEQDQEGFETVGAEMNNTNIYILKPPHAATAFISGRRVSALAPEAEDEVRLASDDELDGHGAGSSCAKYAV